MQNLGWYDFLKAFVLEGEQLAKSRIVHFPVAAGYDCFQILADECLLLNAKLFAESVAHLADHQLQRVVAD